MFAGAKIVKLEQNYRSTKTILAAANAVIANNTQAPRQDAVVAAGDGEPITHAVAPTAEDEAKWVAREIRRLQDDGRRWTDVAILYRSNIQAKVLEEELRMLEVPYVMYGGQQFFERKEVKDVIAYLRVALNPRDELALRRVLNYPARGIGATTVERLVATAQATRATLWDALRGVATTAPRPRAIAARRLDELDTRGESDARARRRSTCAARGTASSFVTVTRRARHEPDVAPLRRLSRRLASRAACAAAQRRIDNVEGLLGSLERFAGKGKGTD